MQLSAEIEAHEATQDQLAHDLTSSRQNLQQVKAQLQLAEKVRMECSLHPCMQEEEEIINFLTGCSTDSLFLLSPSEHLLLTGTVVVVQSPGTFPSIQLTWLHTAFILSVTASPSYFKISSVIPSMPNIFPHLKFPVAFTTSFLLCYFVNIPLTNHLSYPYMSLLFFMILHIPQFLKVFSLSFSSFFSFTILPPSSFISFPPLIHSITIIIMFIVMCFIQIIQFL